MNMDTEIRPTAWTSQPTPSAPMPPARRPAPAFQAFRIDVERRGRRAEVRLGGELDVASSSRLRWCLDDLIDLGVDKVTLDLGGVSFLDCAGLGVIVAAAKRLRVLDGDLTLASPTRAVRRVLTLTGFDRTFLRRGPPPFPR